MKTKHTPGPWIIQDLGAKPGYPDWHRYAIRDSKTNVCLADVGNIDRYFEKNNLDNALLIAAAPELLDALESCVNFFGIVKGHFGCITIMNEVKKVIAKAKGE